MTRVELTEAERVTMAAALVGYAEDCEENAADKRAEAEQRPNEGLLEEAEFLDAERTTALHLMERVSA